MLRNLRPLTAILAVAVAVAFLAVEASAAPKMNAGSRGSRTYSAPPPTATTPNTARPIERSTTQPGQPGSATAARPGSAAPTQGGLFNRPGLLGGLAAGFLGAGLFGLLFGNGLAGGLGGIASFLGLLLQIGIVALVAMLAWRWWQSRQQQPALAGGPPMQRSPMQSLPLQQSPMQAEPLQQSSYDPRPRPGYGGSAPPAAEQQPSIEVSQADLETFERMLSEVEAGYSAEDSVGAAHADDAGDAVVLLRRTFA